MTLAPIADCAVPQQPPIRFWSQLPGLRLLQLLSAGVAWAQPLPEPPQSPN